MKTEVLNDLFEDFFKTLNGFGENNELILFENASNLQKEREVINYLQKGERLMDMARDIYKRKIDKIALTDAEKRIFSFQVTADMTMYDVIQHIARTFTRPCLKSMESCDDEYAKLLLDAVDCPDIEISMSYEDDVFYTQYLRYAACGKKPLPQDDKIIQVTFTEKGYAPMRILGMKNTVHKHKDISWEHSCSQYRFIQAVDLGYFFAALIIYAQVTKEFIRLYNLCAEEQTNDVMYCLFQEVIREYTEKFLSRNLLKFNMNKGYVITSIHELLTYPLHIRYVDERDENFLELMRKQMVNVYTQTSTWRNWARELKGLEPSVGIVNTSDFAICLLLNYDYLFRYHNFTGNNASKEHYWALPQGYVYHNSTKMQDSDCMAGFVSFFRIIAEEKFSIKQQEDYYRELETTAHAKSYQLKKNIPGTIMREMENSLFNEYFGFVEFDALTDVAKAQEIALEFKALKDTYLQSIDASDNAIRFRKLGNHKAVGLYYPSLKSLCVDIHCPQSLVHEFGHLIDYSLGGLSSLNDFRVIKSKYTDYLTQKMKQEEDFCNAMSKKGKYNLSYYTLPTEIFARSFELYISKVLGVRNSIVPETFSKVYPLDDTFLDIMALYFDTLLEVSERRLQINNISSATFVAAGH